ncbi:Cytochrome oxidase biogenesis protein Sco1/SenC/PrrC, thiol-disulfide reductase involved in Cu(I) insertion into CoxII Cu(A) center [Bathymodiolus brooksi thiotrophic gill symbiont]|nr:Cytochrome oxidase biogenesis protein Sco1/SenC/PrrC, thiol-disulfide reductase involved in Cu(I) insertion into CoxII Cu(A) center [Bathymodiolus brooksi thiotrophic gill symbiont]CAC9980299.1 Cytochrome oxidase biogenesis protein Sco1/SenC/PrrC, thiol-disulfide reductase involved in Cu(I) insertion into CoxII Cu(A) center [uncultured Gammaproteobacteria bacterium]
MKKVLIAVVIVLVATALYFYNFDKNYRNLLGKQLKASYILHNPDKPLPKFSLLDHNRQLFDNERLKKGWSLLLFIYTHCPDVCPTELLDMSQLKNLMAKDKTAHMPTVVAITFDPLRDTPEVLKEYITHFDKDFIGVSGEQAQIDQLIKPFGAYYERVIYDKKGKPVTLKAGEKLPKGSLEKGYVINHTAWIYLINPKGEIFAGFPSPHKTSEMMQDIKLMMDSF